MDQNVPDAALREAVFAAVAQENLEAAVGQVERLVRPPEDIYYQELCDSFRRVRTFLPSLLEHESFEIQSEDITRLSPLVFEHINLLGRYAFSLPEAVSRGELRPLRNASDLFGEIA